MNKEYITNAAKEHALEVLGSMQYKKIKTARESIVKDFEAGVAWLLKVQEEQTKTTGFND